MKRMILVALGFLLLAGASFAQAPDTTYVGLFADVTHDTTNVNYIGPTPTEFFMYIYWLPSVRGLNGVEFKITYPSNVMATTVTSNPGIVVEFGTLKNGILATWAGDDCQPAGVWVQSHNVDCLLLTSVASVIQLVAHPTSGVYEVVSCELGWPTEPCILFTNLCMNQACVPGTESTSWGAIKSLYR